MQCQCNYFLLLKVIDQNFVCTMFSSTIECPLWLRWFFCNLGIPILEFFFNIVQTGVGDITVKDASLDGTTEFQFPNPATTLPEGNKYLCLFSETQLIIGRKWHLISRPAHGRLHLSVILPPYSYYVRRAYLAYLAIFGIFGCIFGRMVKWGVPEKILQNAVQTHWS